MHGTPTVSLILFSLFASAWLQCIQILSLRLRYYSRPFCLGDFIAYPVPWLLPYMHGSLKFYKVIYYSSYSFKHTIFFTSLQHNIVYLCVSIIPHINPFCLIRSAWIALQNEKKSSSVMSRLRVAVQTKAVRLILFRKYVLGFIIRAQQRNNTL